MKSAYELAMERLNASDPDAGKALTKEQKKRLADIDQKHQAKLAEREIFLRQQITAAEAAARETGKMEELEQLREQLRRERARLEEEREDEKNKVRRESGK